MTDLLNHDIVGIASRIAAKEVSPLEVTEAALGRIEAIDGQIQAFAHINGNAREQARQLTEELARGHYRGPLHGVPIAIKDNYLTADMPTKAGSVAPGYAFPMRDADAVARLRAAGAVLIGKTRTHEFAWGTETPPTRNPWDPGRIPGGSSGGSGAALASRMAFGALGSDTGGSIRIPASLCGVVGLKPTFGRVSRTGVVPHSWSLDHAGPLTRSTRDAALMLQVLAGHDKLDPATAAVPVADYRAGLDAGIAGMRIGVCRNHFFGRNEVEVERLVDAAIADLQALGARTVDFEIPNLQYGLGAIFAIELASSAAWHDKGLQSGATADMADDVRTLVEIGRLVTAADYLKAEQLRVQLIRDFAKVLEQVDVIVTPSSAVTAWKRGQPSVITGGVEESPLAASWRLTYPYNLTGMPAVSVPCGFDSRGLPAGLQIAGKMFDEATILRVAHAYEGVHRWHEGVPGVAA
ncbi:MULTISPECIES: amidase [Burkholderiaceae]|jgi:aspartyl-tRNA(Asn)/glutamyl-tRNA(Gln) amidotransferase subunit A|uniref:amidase n=1 Tax=Burkholderiaceae TaxID=119060 RepID=UPI0007B0060E|nr:MULTISPECIES: amidase [Burkholderiaceae]MCK9514124.1 amidase family protein [Pigmentiphaga sp.]ANA34786.1 amidase [Ralstonia mannitolilytica]MDN8032979.1 amidase [Burkholderia multivorans]MDN8051546.1 amidase [Burkholderia multivorans]PRH31347.1 Asp-tRNA(Asn)/Glu-tRNA(Gln) amidotransferase GatCAB subunit A [Burkholderia multivorans]